MIRGLEISVPAAQSLGREEGLEIESMTSRQWFSQLYPCNAAAAAAAAKLLQSCPSLCDPIDGSSLGFSVPGILQARTLEWGAISFSSAWKRKGKVKSLSCAWLLATPWTAAYQAPPSMGFSRQEYWSGLPLPSLEWMLNFIKYLFCIYWNDYVVFFFLLLMWFM